MAASRLVRRPVPFAMADVQIAYPIWRVLRTRRPRVWWQASHAEWGAGWPVDLPAIAPHSSVRGRRFGLAVARHGVAVCAVVAKLTRQTCWPTVSDGAVVQPPARATSASSVDPGR